MKASSHWHRFLDLLVGKRMPGDPEFVPMPRPYLWIMRISALAVVLIGLLWLGFTAGIPIIPSWVAAIGAEELRWAMWVPIGASILVQLRYEHISNRRRAATKPDTD